MARQPTFQSTISRIVPPMCRFVIAHCEDGVIAGAYQLYSSGLYTSYCNKAVDCSHCGSRRGKSALSWFEWSKLFVFMCIYLHMYIFTFVIGLEPHCRLFSWEKNKIQKFKVWMWAHVHGESKSKRKKDGKFCQLSSWSREKSSELGKGVYPFEIFPAGANGGMLLHVVWSNNGARRQIFSWICRPQSHLLHVLGLRPEEKQQPRNRCGISDEEATQKL